MTEMMEAEKVCRCPTIEPRDLSQLYKFGNNTEYKDNYEWGHFIKHQQTKKNLKDCSGVDKVGRLPSKAYDGKTSLENYCDTLHMDHDNGGVCSDVYGNLKQKDEIVEVGSTSRNPTFISSIHNSIFRGSRLRKDDSGNYVDPFKDLITLNYGRRLMYDPTHPDMIYGSQFSSELTDMPNVYSFKSLNKLTPEIPWEKDITWKAESESRCWPSKLWKTWTKAAFSPPYDGHDNQCQYSVYKVPYRDHQM